jgi:hypothetical protein
MRSQVDFRVCTPEDEPNIRAFLWSLKDDFRFTERSTIDEITRLLFEKGGVIGGYRGAEMVGMFGYFLGEPIHNYTNQDVGFIYIAGLANHVRRTGAFRSGAKVLSKTLKSLGVRELRCHAAEQDVYTNQLYARLGKPIAKEKNRRGDTCILYANSIKAVLTRLATPSRKQRLSQHVPA